VTYVVTYSSNSARAIICGYLTEISIYLISKLYNLCYIPLFCGNPRVFFWIAIYIAAWPNCTYRRKLVEEHNFFDQTANHNFKSLPISIFHLRQFKRTHTGMVELCYEYVRDSVYCKSTTYEIYV